MASVILILVLAGITAIYGASHTGSRVMRAEGDGGSNSEDSWDVGDVGDEVDLPF